MLSVDTLKLITACHAGDPAAVEAFVQANQQWVYRFALSVLDDSAEADEAAQDALVAALRALDSYRGASGLKTWLYAITLNVCRRRLRKRQALARLRAAVTAVLRLQAPAADPEAAAIDREGEDVLWCAVSTLGEKHRLPVLLRYYHDLSIGEIAEVLAIPEGTVLSRLNTARERLRATLQAKRDLN